MNSFPTRRLSLLLAYVLFLVFVGMRFYHLAEKPMHNDESVNSFFLTNLIRDNAYKYDPNNYHGPFLYYVQLIPTYVTALIKDGFSHFSRTSIVGVTDISIRSGVVVAGLLLLVGIFFTQHRLGFAGAFAAFLLAGLSCDLLYYGRYFIHETYFVFFTWSLYWGFSVYQDTNNQTPLKIGLWSLMFLLTIKETAIVNFFVMGFSFVCVEYFFALRHRLGMVLATQEIKKKISATLRDISTRNSWTVVAIAVVWALLYSSFGKNPHGLLDAFRAFMPWLQQGVESGHNKPFLYFIKDVLWPYEKALVLCSLMGGLLSLYRNDKKGLFLASWTAGIVLAYSMIPYKTVWCVITLLLPMVLLSGWGVQQLIIMTGLIDSQLKRLLARVFVWTTVVILVTLQLPQTLKIVYREADSETHAQAYVHTVRDVYYLVDRIAELASLSGEGKDMLITFVGKEYWPIPYYLRSYTNAKFWGTYVDIPELDSPVLISDPDQEAALVPLLKDKYFVEEYWLRGGRPLRLRINERFFNIKSLVPPVPRVFSRVTPPGTLAPGLIKKVWLGRRYEGLMLDEKAGVNDFQFDWLNNAKSAYSTPFCILWKGYMNVEVSGEQTFLLGSDDGSELWIDDVLAIDNGGNHAYVEKKKTFAFDSGYHKIELRYFDGGGRKQLKWLRINREGQEESIPFTSFFYDPSKITKGPVHGR